MNKLVYQPRTDFFIEVGLINLESLLNEATFEVEVTAQTINKIQTHLNNSLDTNIICFPEYTYSDQLFDLYRDFSNQYNIIIIGGSGIESYGNNYYAYCPIFIPNKELIKVYKKHVTVEERTYSRGRLISYPNETERDFLIDFNNYEYVFSVYICYDFLQENYSKRSDIVFVPQFETSPRLFINTSTNIIQGFDNFVLGINNSDGISLRSLGFGNLNPSLINAFSKMRKRKKYYKDEDQKELNEHFSLIYDLTDEQLLRLRLNLANPVPKHYNFSYTQHEPTILIR
jgi:hypothetical protein